MATGLVAQLLLDAGKLAPRQRIRIDVCSNVTRNGVLSVGELTLQDERIRLFFDDRIALGIEIGQFCQLGIVTVLGAGFAFRADVGLQ